MPISIKGTSPDWREGPNFNPYGDGAFVRKMSITDKDGIVREINCQKDLEAILAQMTPEELEKWKANYRFDPIYNDTGIIDYTGTLRDLA